MHLESCYYPYANIEAQKKAIVVLIATLFLSLTRAHSRGIFVRSETLPSVNGADVEDVGDVEGVEVCRFEYVLWAPKPL